MRALTALWQHLANGFAPAYAGSFPAGLAHDKPGAEAAYRKSVHDVTLEQLGIDHWSCHTLL